MLKKIMLGLGLGTALVTLAYAQGIAPAPGPDAAAGPGVAGGRGAATGPGPARVKKLPTVEEWNNMGPSAKAFVDKAQAIAGDDTDLQFEFHNVCAADGGSNKRKNYPIPNDPRLQPYASVSSGPQVPVAMKPYKIFDNLWYFGTTDVGSYLLVTKDGYILFDALDNMHEARDIIVGGMKSVGLDPKKIKWFIVSHNHLDHTGGLHYIQSNFHPRTVMGRDDWRIYLDTMAKAADAAKSNPNSQSARLDDLVAGTEDIDSEDGMKVTLGGTTVNIYSNPGHTPGSIAEIFPVKYKGRQFNVLLMPAANDIDSRSDFVGSYEHVWQMALNAKVETWLHVHPNINTLTLASMHYMDDHPNEKPLWLYGVAKTAKYIEIARACTQARMEILGW